MRLVSELRRRNVLRMAALYVVAAWLIVQVAGALIELANLPDWIGTTILWLLAIGFPIALIFSWFYEMTPEGVVYEKDIDRENSITHITGRRLDFLVISLLCAALILFAYDKWWTTAPEVQSIAVLPFENMSDDPDNEYFSDGLSEEILNLLAKIPALKVIGRTSSFAFKGKNEDLRTIGQALGVNTLLEGSVRKSGDRVRITAQLIDVADGTHIWSETYDRKLNNIFEVQDSVAAAIIETMQVHIDANVTRGRPTESSEAYALFLKATVAIWDPVTDSEPLLKQAIELDPSFAEAHELLAYNYWRGAGWKYKSDDAKRLSGEAAAKAIAYDPDLVLAKALHRIGESETNSLLGEIEAFELAFREQPNDQRILDSLFYYLLLSGYLQEALSVAERSVNSDPLSPSANFRFPAALFAVGRTDEGLAALELLEQLDPISTHWAVGEVHLVYGRDDIAIAHFEADLANSGFADSKWVSELVTGARTSAAGQEYLKRRIPQIAASMPEDFPYDLRERISFWFLFFGYVDSYFELIFELNPSDSTLWDVSDLIATGTAYPELRFRSHPKYLEVAELVGIVDVWEQRGPPDFCKIINDQWVCE